MILASASPASVVLALAAACAYALPAAAAVRLSDKAARAALLAAWLLHALVLAWGLLGDSPRFGFAPALSITAWLVLTVYAIEQRMFPKLEARWALAGLGAAAVLLALAFPGTPLHVSASPWLPLHLALGIASYGLFAAAVVHAWLMTRAEKNIRVAADPHAGIPLLTLERLTFRFVGAGFVLLSATLLAGFFFTETLYGQGRAWKWDHKTIFSVLSWMAFASLLIGRARFGWRGRTAVRMLYAGAVLLLLAYVGSRFVLEVVLAERHDHMKYLIVIAVIAIAYAIWRSNRETERAERAEEFKAKNPQPPSGQPQDMVRCPVCALHLPRTDALAGPDGQLYCSSEHRLQSTR